MNLLIVNDEVIAIQGMMQAISWQDIGIDEVRTAFDAQMARATILQWPVDIILCDIEMLGESGIELLVWICENGYTMESIILTCHADFEFAQQAVRLGCRDYILTPATYEVITEKVAEAAAAVCKRREDEEKLHYGDLWVSVKLKEKSVEPPKKSREIVEDIKAYICEYLDDEHLSVGRLAQMNYLSPDYLNRIFKKHQGCNIRQFIMDERMRLAATLLRKEKGTFVQIAEMIGYTNYPSFVVAFKNYYGCSPSEYVTDQ